VVAEGPRPQWINTAPSSGQVGQSYAGALSATGDVLHYEVTGLPPGLFVNATTGMISGFPTAAGTYSGTAYAVNAAGAERTTFSITVAKGVPSIITAPTATTLSPGQPLSAAVLSGGLASVPGTFAFASPATVPPSGVSQQTVRFTPTDAANYDAVTFTIPVKVDYGSGFEGITKSNYTTGNVAIGGINWEFAEALIASGDANDFKSGLQSVRLRGYATSAITMLGDLPGGIGTISFQHRRYGTDTQVAWIVEYSTNQGTTWVEAGRFTAGENVATFSATPNIPAPARLRIRAAVVGSSNRRTNIDDLVITSYTTPAGMTFGQWSGGLERTPDLVRAYAVGGAPNAQSAGQAPSASFEGAMLLMEALVRTNDPSLRVYAHACIDLIAGGWSTNGVTAVDVPKRSDDPADTARRVFSVPRGTDLAKFLRLRIELDP
jgi:hypothetical protein